VDVGKQHYGPDLPDDALFHGRSRHGPIFSVHTEDGTTRILDWLHCNNIL